LFVFSSIVGTAYVRSSGITESIQTKISQTLFCKSIE
jgi:hypothetical protein